MMLNVFLGVLGVLDWVFFGMVALSVFYLFFFVVASKFYKVKVFPEAEKQNRILVLYPAYKEDRVIASSVEQFLLQDYPRDKYELVVISDHMQESTNERIRELSATVLEVKFEQSSKAKAMNFAVEQYRPDDFDIVTILDADNLVEPCYLSEINKVYGSGIKAIQAHRIAKNTQTDVAVFDAVSEEVNHSVFRKGHGALGLSSALVGSGMAFDFKWFREHSAQLCTAGEDKELEAMLLKESIYIQYLDRLYVKDEKTSQQQAFSTQRQRWLAAQYTMLLSKIKDIPMCFRTRNFNYLDKIIQWMLLPRVVMFGLTGVIAFLLVVFAFESAVKWLVLLLIMCFIFALATPWPLFRLFLHTCWKTVPVLFVTMGMNFFRMKNGKRFLHTPHGLE